SGTTRVLAAAVRDRAIKWCVEGIESAPGGEQPTLILGDRARLAGKPFFVGVIMEVNPFTKEQRELLKTWASRPAGSTGISPSDVLFGAAESLFGKAIAGAADKTLQFRTQVVTP